MIDRAQTRVYAFLNIAGFGMISDMIEQDPRDFVPEITASTIERHRDVLVGVKSAHYQGPDWSSVEKAVQAGELAEVPVMVDFGYFRRERPYWTLVGEKLRPGDISTHCFRGTVPVADERGHLYPYLRRARERGVVFDLGHGQGSFLFGNAVPAIREGFYPDTVSSDLHGGSMNAAMTAYRFIVFLLFHQRNEQEPCQALSLLPGRGHAVSVLNRGRLAPLRTGQRPTGQ